MWKKNGRARQTTDDSTITAHALHVPKSYGRNTNTLSFFFNGTTAGIRAGPPGP